MPELFDILDFHHAKANDIEITTSEPDWTEVLALQANLKAGTYAAVFALQFNMNSTSQSFLYRFSTDGGSTWGPIYQKEVKDRSNTEVIEVVDVLEYGADAPVDIRVEVTREGTATTTVIEAFISVERKK